MSYHYQKEVLSLALRRQSLAILIDEDDFEKYRYFGVSVSSSGYLMINYPGSIQKFLHKEIAGAGSDILVDHKNGNKFDVRKENLRLSTVSQNAMNKIGSSSTGYKGVTFDKSRNKYKAHIEVHGQHKNLGRFAMPEDAALAYNEAAIKYFGEYARLNEVLK